MAPPGGYPQKMEFGRFLTKNWSFLGFKPGFGISRPRSVQGADRFSIWGDRPDRRFWVPQGANVPANPYPCSGLCLRRAGCHAILWTDRGPGLRSELVISCPSASKVPKSQFSSFSGVQVRPKHPSLRTSLRGSTESHLGFTCSCVRTEFHPGVPPEFTQG